MHYELYGASAIKRFGGINRPENRNKSYLFHERCVNKTSVLNVVVAGRRVREVDEHLLNGLAGQCGQDAVNVATDDGDFVVERWDQLSLQPDLEGSFKALFNTDPMVRGIF